MTYNHVFGEIILKRAKFSSAYLIRHMSHITPQNGNYYKIYLGLAVEWTWGYMPKHTRGKYYVVKNVGHM